MKRVLWTILLAFVIASPAAAAMVCPRASESPYAVPYAAPFEVSPAADQDLLLVVVVRAASRADAIVIVLHRNEVLGIFSYRQLPTGLKLDFPEVDVEEMKKARKLIVALDKAEKKDVSDEVTRETIAAAKRTREVVKSYIGKVLAGKRGNDYQQKLFKELSESKDVTIQIKVGFPIIKQTFVPVELVRVGVKKEGNKTTVLMKREPVPECAVSNSVGVWFLFCGGVIFLIVSI